MTNNSPADPGSRQLKLHLWMVVFTAIIAGSFPVVAAITAGIDSTVLTFWRFLTATAVFALMLPFVKGRRVPGFRDLGRYSVVGGSYALFFILMFQALKETSPLNTSTIYTTMPLMTLLLGRLVGEPLRMRQLAILGLSMVASLWVIFRGNWERMAGFHFLRGDVIFFIGTALLAIYTLSMKKMQRDEPKVYFTFFSLLVATIALFIAVLFHTGAPTFPNAGTWLGLAYLAGPSTAGTFWILQHTAPRLGPGRVVAYTFLTPSLVACLEWGLGLSPPDWSVLPGIILTLAAVWLLQLKSVAGKQ